MKYLIDRITDRTRIPLQYRMGLALASMFVAVGCDTADPTMLPPPPHPMLPDPDSVDAMMNTPFIIPPVLDPVIYLAKEVDIPADERVVGVVVGETVRAYLISALKHMQSHVVNENQTEFPVCITYCDRTDCVRVLGADKGDTLTVQTGGFQNGEMLLRLNEQIYPQNSADLPLKDVQYTRTTWGEWLQANPSTTVYLGYRKDDFLKR
ncbi:MAG: DUF3179 domain-containing (seleno)protein [Planctomyces sp.]